MGGFGGAGAFIILPLFVAEIAEDSVRGTLGSLLVLSCNIGILIAFILGNYLSYHIQAIILALVPVLFCIAFSFFPETPQYLMTMGKEEVKITNFYFECMALEQINDFHFVDQEAEESLRFYRNVSNVKTSEETEPFKSELEKLRTSNQLMKKTIIEDTSLTWSDLSM